MMKTEQTQMVWMEFYLAVVKFCEEDCSAHCDAFAVERRKDLGSVRASTTAAAQPYSLPSTTLGAC